MSKVRRVVSMYFAHTTIIFYTTYMMQTTILLALIFLMGFLVAIPAGPVQIEVVKRSVNGHLKPSFMVILGAFFVDMFYGVVAFFGIAPFLEHSMVQAVFWLTGSIVLAVLGFLTIRHSRHGQAVSRSSRLLSRKRWSLLSGVSLSVANPVMVLWWLSSLNIFRDLGLVPAFTPSVALSFILAGSLGLATYLLVLSLVLYRVKTFISSRRMQHINAALGVFLILLAAYFLVHAVISFAR